MEIIKIGSACFKIILSKDDLQKYGAENKFENKDTLETFFEDIIHQTNEMYGYPFSESAIDAEFFESKDGGGELFLSTAKQHGKSSAVILSTGECDNLFLLCSRLKTMAEHEKSSLFTENGIYFLVIFPSKRNDNIIPVAKEFGKCVEAGKLKLWHLEEHARLLCQDNAIEVLSSFT